MFLILHFYKRRAHDWFTIAVMHGCSPPHTAQYGHGCSHVCVLQAHCTFAKCHTPGTTSVVPVVSELYACCLLNFLTESRLEQLLCHNRVM